MEAVVAFVGRLRRLFARYPLAMFFVLTTTVGLVVRYLQPAFITIFWPGLVALLVCWVTSEERAVPSRRGWRVLLGLSVFGLAALHDLVVGDLSGFGGFALWPWVGTWLAAGLIWSAVLSPHMEVRALARPLVGWRLPLRVIVVALVALPLAGAFTVAVSHLLGHTPSPPADNQGVPIYSPGLDLGRLALNSLALGLTSTGAVVGWYGFAAVCLLRRFSPLVAALGVALAQEVFLVIWVAPSLATAFWLISVFTAIATATLCIWLYVRSRSLIPVLVVQAVSHATAAVTAHRAYTYGDWSYVYLGLECAIALALVVAGRMWRRPPGAIPTVVVPGEAGAMPGTASS